jgi:hypothetical protein
MTYGSGGRRKAGEAGVSSDLRGVEAITVRADPPSSVERCPLPVPVARHAADAALGAYLGVLAAGFAALVTAPVEVPVP